MKNYINNDNLDNTIGSLRDIDILERLVHKDESKRIIITPLISIKEQLGPVGIDLRLSNQFITADLSSHTHINPFFVSYNKSKCNFIKTHYSKESFVLHPNQLVLACTLEYIKIPNDIQAKINGRSSWGREGVLVHLTAEQIHPGSEGVITFELLNAGPVPIEIYPGMRISHLTFEQLPGDPIKPYSKGKKFFKNLGPLKGKIESDYEIDKLRQLSL